MSDLTVRKILKVFWKNDPYIEPATEKIEALINKARIEARFEEHENIMANVGAEYSRAIHANPGLGLDPDLIKKEIAKRAKELKSKQKGSELGCEYCSGENDKPGWRGSYSEDGYIGYVACWNCNPKEQKG